MPSMEGDPEEQTNMEDETRSQMDETPVMNMATADPTADPSETQPGCN